MRDQMLTVYIITAPVAEIASANLDGGGRPISHSDDFATMLIISHIVS